MYRSSFFSNLVAEKKKNGDAAHTRVLVFNMNNILVLSYYKYISLYIYSNILRISRAEKKRAKPDAVCKIIYKPKYKKML